MGKNRPTLLICDDRIGRDSDAARSLAMIFEVQFASEAGDRAPPAPAEGFVLTGADGKGAGAGGAEGLSDGQTAGLLNSLGEGICLCDSSGNLLWSNASYLRFTEAVRKRIERTCGDAARVFGEQAEIEEGVSRRFAVQVDDGRYYEMITSPVAPPNQNKNHDGEGGENGNQTNDLRVAAIIWDNTRERRLQKKLDAIDRAGGELVRIESDAIASLNTAQRLALLEDKIINYTRDLLNFDHFNIYLLEKKSNRLMPVMTVGMPEGVTEYELYADSTGSGISGYVAATGKSYICHDVQNDPRYLPGLEHAASSLSVPLRMHDQVIGVFNVESEKPGGFTEDDRQFAEIFGRYTALALNILDLLVVERCTTSGTVAVNVIGEISHPLNDITVEAEALREAVLTDPEALAHVDRVLALVQTVRQKVEDVARGPRSILGIQEALENAEIDPNLLDRHVMVADDEPNIRQTIAAVLTKRGCRVTTCAAGQEAIDLFQHLPPGGLDLVLSDISMPDRNGYEVFAAARKMDVRIPVILMTGFGYDPHHSIVRASQEGLQCVLFKPFQVEQLLEEVTKAMVARAMRG